ncbi:MAG: hypothetical protein AAGA43_12685 [Bacteroidota bacterium]
MILNGGIQHFPREIRILILLYLAVTSSGFISALQFVNTTTEGGVPQGIEENYLGNENDLEAEELKFAKSERQILNIVHAHMLSMGMLFLLLALLVATTPLAGVLRKILLYEPLVSVLLTFGGIYLLWKGVLWMKYVIMISGIAMTLSYVLSVVIIGYWVLKPKDTSDSQ